MNDVATAATPAELIRNAATSLGVTMSAVFVPFSLSRNAVPRNGQDKPWRSLNWKVTLERNGRAFLETDYSQGEGHAPAYLHPTKWKGNKHVQRRALDIEIETGFAAIAETWAQGEPRQGRTTKHRIPSPPIEDVLSSLVLDSNVLDYSGFEAWADEYGYDADSRTAEATWKACLETALKLRAAIGEAGIEALRVAGEDY
jgi:hypothetical protein